MRGTIAVLVVVLAATQAAPQTPQQTVPVFGAEVENVYIDAFVTHKGVAQTGLRVSNFELKDNGVVQDLEMVSAETQPLLAVLAFDISSSLGGEKLQALRSASQTFLDTLRPEDEATLFTFADEVRWLVPPTSDKGEIRQALLELQPGGGTPILDALYATILLPPSKARTLIVLFTDGVDNSSWLDWRQLLLVAERSNALIHVVSLPPPEMRVRSESYVVLQGRDLSARDLTLEYEGPWSLKKIAEATGGRFWKAESLALLKTSFAAIAEAMGRRYVLRYSPEGVKRPGWHKIELRLRGARGDVHTRNGYWVRSPAP